MSARKSWVIWCDACGETMGSGDLGNEKAAEGRNQAKFDGAHVNLPGGRDICEGCWDEGER